MAHVLNDRIKETTTTTGTGNINLAGAETGFETFVSGIGDGNTTYYAISHQSTTEFEIGLGTVTDASPDTISGRTNSNVISSSNSDNVVDFSAGTKDVFCTLPASKAITLDHQSVVNVVGSISLGDSSNRVILSKGSDNQIQFQTEASGQSPVTSNSGATKVYADISSMTATSPTTGDQAFVSANSGLYIFNGGGWYKIATVNTSPTISSPSSGANNTLATNGTATTIELVGSDTDPGTTLQNSYAVTTGSLTNGGGTTATITTSSTSGGTYTSLSPSTNTTNRFFKVTPTTNTSHGGSFSLTFSMSDTISAATTVQNFTLTFIPEGSAVFDGTGDGLVSATSSNLSLSTGDFTIEFWVYPNNLSSTQLVTDHRLGGGGNDIAVFLDTNGKVNLHANSSTRITSASAISASQWKHIAVVRSSSTTTLYLDGIADSTTYSDSNDYGGTAVTLGKYYNGNQFELNGYISNFRLVKGSVAYTINTASGGSTAFDGNGDALTVPASADFAFGTGDFTIEAWVYSTTYANFPYIFDGRTNPGTSSNAPALYIHSSNTINYYVAGSNQISTSYSSYQNQWTHIAIVRNSGTTTLYLDGVSAGTWSDSTNYTDQGPLVIGRHGDSSLATYCLNGYISNFRIVKGTAVYTSAFTPSNIALTAITNTKLLTCQNSTGTITDASSSSHSITASGNAAASTQKPFKNYFTVPSEPLTAITNTQLLTCQENTGTITDSSSNDFTMTVVGNTAANALNPF